MSPLFPLVPSGLDVNGPILSIYQQPVGFVTTNVARGKAEFIGLATATFPEENALSRNTGSIAYQWYRNGIALQDEGDRIIGSATTTLTLNELVSPTNDNDQIFLRVDYVPSAQTGNAINEPINTITSTLTVLPTISIVTQPVDVKVNEFDPDLTQGVATDQSDVEATFSVVATTSNADDPDPSEGAKGTLSYSWWIEVDGIDYELSKGVPDRFTVTTPTLSSITIKKDFPGRHLVYCRISHTSADPRTVQSSKAELEILPSRGIISYERIGNSNQTAFFGNRNLSSAGKLQFQADPEIETTTLQNLPFTASQNTIVLYAPERNVTAKVTMGGARGESFGENAGGNGGLSVFKMTFLKNEEYVVRLGVNETQGFGIVGGSSEFGGGGGGMTVLYHKGRVIAACGGGGGAGQAAAGGDGGGVNVDGANGFGSNSGAGGQKYNIDTIPSDGNDNNGTIGGVLGGCSEGNYWNTQGLTACSDIGVTKFRDKDGNEISNSASILRGYKAGQGYRNNGGDAEVAGGYQGGGGSGARGGNAASANNSGGGGGSGYQSSEIELLNSFSRDTSGNVLLSLDSNRLGGNEDVGFITIEEFEEEPGGFLIEQPQASKYSTSSIAAVIEKQVDWDIERDSGLATTLVFERTFGLGPKRLILGPTTENLETVIGDSAVYRLLSITPNNANYRIVNHTLQIDGDRDGTFNDLSITPNKGRFFIDDQNQYSWIADWNEPENQEKTLDRPAPQIEFEIDTSTIRRYTAEEAILSWTVTGYNVTDIDLTEQVPGESVVNLGSVLATSTRRGRTFASSTRLDPLRSRTYTLTAKNSGGVYSTSIDTSSLSLEVIDQPPVEIISFTADDVESLTYNNPGATSRTVTLRWQTNGRTKSVTITDDNGNTYPINDPNLWNNGLLKVVPPTDDTTTYTINIVNLDDIASTTKSVSVKVLKQVAVVGVITSFDSGTEITEYEHPGSALKQISLQWDVNANTGVDSTTTNDTSSIVITGSDGTSYTNLLSAGTINVTPPKTQGSATTTTYTLTATNVDGVITNDTAPVTVLNQAPIVIDSFTTTDTSGNPLSSYNNPGATLKQMRLNWQTTGYVSNLAITDNDGTTHGTGLAADSQITVTPPKSTQGSDSPLTAGTTDTTTYTLTATNSDNIITSRTVDISVKNQLKNELSLSLNPTSYTNPASSNITYGVSGDFRSFELKDTLDNVVLVSGTNSGTFSGRVATVGSGSTHSPDADTSRTYQLTAINRDRVSSVTTANLSVAQQPPVDFDQELTAASTSFIHTSSSGTTLSWNVGDAPDDTVSSITLQQSTNAGASFSNIQVGVGTEVTGFAVDPNPGQTIFRIRTVNTDNIVRNSDTTVNVSNNPAPNVTASVSSDFITNSTSIQGGNSGSTITFAVATGNSSVPLELISSSSAVTITNKRTGSTVLSLSNSSTVRTYDIPTSQLAVNQDTEFEIKATTIDGETGSATVSVRLLRARPVDIVINNANGVVRTGKRIKFDNSTAVRTSGITNAFNWAITGSLSSGASSVIVKRLISTTGGEIGRRAPTVSETLETITSTNTSTGTISIPGATIDSLSATSTTLGDNELLYHIQATNIDGISSFAKVYMRMRPQPAVNLTLTTTDERILLTNSSDTTRARKSTNNIFVDESTTLTATVSAGDGSADHTSISIDNGVGAVTNSVAKTVSPKDTTTFKATVTNLDGITTTAEQEIRVEQNKIRFFNFGVSPLIATSTLKDGTQVTTDIKQDGFRYNIITPYNASSVSIPVRYIITGPYREAKIAVKNKSDKYSFIKVPGSNSSDPLDGTTPIEFPTDFIGEPGDSKEFKVYMNVCNKFGEWGGWFYIVCDIEIQENPDPYIRYYLYGISKFYEKGFVQQNFPASLDYLNYGRDFLFTVRGGIPGRLPNINRTFSASWETEGELDGASNYFYAFPRDKRPNSGTIGALPYIDDLDMYAWKGPAVLGQRPFSYSYITRPPYSTGLYLFKDPNGGYFYTLSPSIALSFRRSNSSWDYAKDTQGRLAPAFYVYHPTSYIDGKTAFSDDETSGFDEQTVGNGDPKTTPIIYNIPEEVRMKDYKMGIYNSYSYTNNDCDYMAYIDLRKKADTVGETSNSPGFNATVDTNRGVTNEQIESGEANNYVPVSIVRTGCYDANHAQELLPPEQRRDLAALPLVKVDTVDVVLSVTQCSSSRPQIEYVVDYFDPDYAGGMEDTRLEVFDVPNNLYAYGSLLTKTDTDANGKFITKEGPDSIKIGPVKPDKIYYGIVTHGYINEITGESNNPRGGEERNLPESNFVTTETTSFEIEPGARYLWSYHDIYNTTRIRSYGSTGGSRGRLPISKDIEEYIAKNGEPPRGRGAAKMDINVFVDDSDRVGINGKIDVPYYTKIRVNADFIPFKNPYNEYVDFGVMGKRGNYNISRGVEDVLIELTDNAVFTPNKTDSTKYDIIVFSEAEYATKVNYTTLLGSSPIAGLASGNETKTVKIPENATNIVVTLAGGAGGNGGNHHLATESGGKGALGHKMVLKLDSSVFAGRTVRLTGATAGGDGQNAKTDGSIVYGGSGGRGFYSGSDGLSSGDTSLSSGLGGAGGGGGGGGAALELLAPNHDLNLVNLNIFDDELMDLITDTRGDNRTNFVLLQTASVPADRSDQRDPNYLLLAFAAGGGGGGGQGPCTAVKSLREHDGQLFRTGRYQRDIANAKVHDRDYGMTPRLEQVTDIHNRTRFTGRYVDWHQTGTSNNYQEQIDYYSYTFDRHTGGGGGAGAHGPHESISNRIGGRGSDNWNRGTRKYTPLDSNGACLTGNNVPGYGGFSGQSVYVAFPNYRSYYGSGRYSNRQFIEQLPLEQSFIVLESEGYSGIGDGFAMITYDLT